MEDALVITPVKDSLQTALTAAAALAGSTVPVRHVIYNDFSAPETTTALRERAAVHGYTLIDLQELTDTPSPNYKLVLQLGAEEARRLGQPLIVVESDVEVRPDTIQKLVEFHDEHPECGLAGCITTDEEGRVNYPYAKFDGLSAATRTTKSLSFCCTLMSARFVREFDFAALDPAKDWYDTMISRAATERGYENYILADLPVIHRPHSSRAWKQLKYSNPLRYYLSKFLKGRDKI